MFTDSQMETYAALQRGELGCPSDQDWVPPRTADIRDFPAVNPSEWQDTPHALLVGFRDPELEECECGRDHITYATIRGDGLMADVVTSGTIGERAFAANIDLMFIAMGLVDPEELEPLIPTWDEAREVTPDEWPAIEVRTDMADFEF